MRAIQKFPRNSFTYVDASGDILQMTEAMSCDIFGWRFYAYVVTKDYWCMRPVWLDELPAGEVRELGEALVAERKSR